LLLIAPILGAEVAASAEAGARIGPATLAGFAERLGSVDQLVAVCFLLMLVASLQIGIAFFAASGASIATIELVARFVLPGLPGSGRKARGPYCPGGHLLLHCSHGNFHPLSATIFASCPSASRRRCCRPFWDSAGYLGQPQRRTRRLVLGLIIVVFTEPLGLIAFNGLFVELPLGTLAADDPFGGLGFVLQRSGLPTRIAVHAVRRGARPAQAAA
jgi:hypothetical protein